MDGIQIYAKVTLVETDLLPSEKLNMKCMEKPPGTQTTFKGIPNLTLTLENLNTKYAIQNLLYIVCLSLTAHFWVPAIFPCIWY